MSLLSVLTASMAIVFFFGFAAAEISAANCSSTWKWSFNSLGQDPCLTAAYMYSTCAGGTYRIDPLPPGYHYVGPWKGIDEYNLCECSTVGYSLISACCGCQGGKWATWSQYVANCTTILPPSSFPNPIPAAVRIPQWALLDVTKEKDWDFDESYAIRDKPELGPGTILGHSGGHSSNVGAIAGGTAGVIAALSILVAALLFYLRRRRSQVTPASFAVDDSVSNPHMGQAMSGQETPATSLPEKSSSPKPYDPSDPTTFPSEYQGAPNLPYIPAQVSSLSSTKTLYTTAAMPNSNAVGYHGLPIV